jgi:hypothetical protein
MESKRFLFCSLDAALIGDLAWQVSKEGHDVRYYVEAESDREIADGFVPETDVLRAYEQAWGHRTKGFQLQRRVSGVAVAVCGFFDGERFVEPVNVNFENEMWDLSFTYSRETLTETQTVAS